MRYLIIPWIWGSLFDPKATVHVHSKFDLYNAVSRHIIVHDIEKIYPLSDILPKNLENKQHRTDFDFLLGFSLRVFFLDF